MRIKVKSEFLFSNGRQNFTMDGMVVMLGDRVVGNILDIDEDNDIVMDIIDPVAVSLIKNGIFDQPVSMGCIVDGCRIDGEKNEKSDNKNKGKSDTAGSKSKVKSDVCGHVLRLRKLGVSEK